MILVSKLDLPMLGLEPRASPYLVGNRFPSSTNKISIS